MDYSASNPVVWDGIMQLCNVAVMILLANIIRRKVKFVRSSLLPIAVLAGFLALAAKLLHIINVNIQQMELLTYHGIAIGFIALSLRIPEANQSSGEKLVGLKSGAIIVSSYLIQGVAGLLTSITLAYTLQPGLFKAAGILLPLGYGQGPGQANNTGTTYEVTWGFAGGRSFGLALAAMGYICACVVGVLMLNYLAKQGKIRKIDHEQLSGSVTIDHFQSKTEVPVSESIDRFSIQAALVLAVYLITFLLIKGITDALTAFAPGVANLVNSLLWGFNFIVSSALATLTRVVLSRLEQKKIIHHQYQNNYLLSRISGLAFDVMIVAGIASIEIEELKGLVLPFVVMSVLGAVITYFHLAMVSKAVYRDYYYEGLLSMYGMMTGTISSGVLLLREIDPQMQTPAANNLVVGSSFGILLGVPMLIFIGLAPKSDAAVFATLGGCIVYYFILLGVIMRKHGKK